MRYFVKLIIAAFVMVRGSSAFANYPVDWQIDMQEAATPVMEKLRSFHHDLLFINFGIVAFVTILLIFVCIKFSKKNNPVPSKTSHNLVIEVIWTLIPTIIIILMAVPSFKILYYVDQIPKSDMTIKVVGRQWYWQYEYPDNEKISFDSNIVDEKDLKPGQIRLLDVDNRVVVPVDTNVRLLITSGDVIHSWSLPAFGVKMDAIPGRTNESWFNVTKPGVYYGQCSELCGVNHGFMPIAVEAVSKEDFAKWVEGKKTSAVASASN